MFIERLRRERDEKVIDALREEIYALRRWIDGEIRATGSDIRKEALQDVIDRINKLEDER